MLETTMATTFVPGANLKGQVAGANWMFLRPTLPAQHVVCIGTPATATLITLAGFCQEVSVVVDHVRQAQAVRAAAAKAALSNVNPLLVEGSQQIPLADHSAEIIVVLGLRQVWRLQRNEALRQELQRLLHSKGVVYFEHPDWLAPLLGDHSPARLLGDGATQLAFWQTPLRGEMHTAVPASDGLTAAYFRKHGLYSTSFQLDRLKRIWKLASSRPAKALPRATQKAPAQENAQQSNSPSLFARWDQRRGVLVGASDAGLAEHPPTYLQRLAGQAGVRLEGFRWGLSARGEYSSRKLLFFLFDQADPAPNAPPTYIVKMVRNPVFNARLENEQRALSTLYERGIGCREILPQVVFAGHHAGLAIVGETAIQGTPFRQRTQSTPDCPYAQAAIAWFVKLGQATADPFVASPAEAAANLEKLFARFCELYHLTDEQSAFLARQIATVQSQAVMPLVFQHGDPGPWNMLVTSQGHVALLDWEAAEPSGMPLWDLFYFLRSYCVDAARAQGVRSSLAGFTQQFLNESPLSALVIDSVKRYCTAVNLSPQLVEPLFYTCWMHRALKEATRLPPQKLESGHYANLLRLCIAERNSSVLNTHFTGLV